MKLIFTQHAQERLESRSITISQIEAVLLSPAFVEPDPAGDGRFRAWGALLDRDGRMLRVIYTVEDSDFRLISAFIDRGAARFLPKTDET